MDNNKEKLLQDAHDNVHPGWWPILDKYIPQLLAIDPNCEIWVKEKFGLLRLQARSENRNWTDFTEIEEAAEKESACTCEFCGQPGNLRSDMRWVKTLCDRCSTLDAAGKREVIQNAERDYKK